MDADAKLNKALMFLDRSRHEEGERVLREVVADAEADEVSRLRAHCVLGDLLHTQGRDEEAVGHLTIVAEAERDDDVLDFEQHRAAKILAEIRR